jgi:hypothetical protein
VVYGRGSSTATAVRLTRTFAAQERPHRCVRGRTPLSERFTSHPRPAHIRKSWRLGSGRRWTPARNSSMTSTVSSGVPQTSDRSSPGNSTGRLGRLAPVCCSLANSGGTAHHRSGWPPAARPWRRCLIAV